MWDQDGMWRPQDYSLHNTYHQISSRSTEDQKIQYIDNLFNTILERAHSRANFSDLRAEIVDHYISELGDDFEIEDGLQFRQKVYDYHKKFGGPGRIVKLGTSFLKTRRRLIQRQFFKWFIEFWYVHLMFIPIAIVIVKYISMMAFSLSILVWIILTCSYEGIKYYRDRHIRKQIKAGDSSINFFYQYKLEIFSSLYLALNILSNIDQISAFSMSPLLHTAIVLWMYICTWAYYYHLNICQKRIAPLLDHYKAQMI